MESIILISILFVKSLSKNLSELGRVLPCPMKKRKCPIHDLPDRTEHFSFEYIYICSTGLLLFTPCAGSNGPETQRILMIAAYSASSSHFSYRVSSFPAISSFSLFNSISFATSEKTLSSQRSPSISPSLVSSLWISSSTFFKSF